jgi:hypothetical protein
MAKTVNVLDVIALFRQAYAEKWGYIWGGTGQIHTQKAQDNATRAQTKRYGQKWVGRRVADCSGLFYWAYKQLGGYMYHGSNTMWNKYSKAKGKLQNGRRTDGQALKPGSAVFLVKGNDRHHVGLYVGDGEVIEAKGTAYGVVESKITRWNEWAELTSTAYAADSSADAPDSPADVPVTPAPTENPADAGDGASPLLVLRNGSRGTQVKVLQYLLIDAGFDCDKVDGIVGKNTVAAVKAFQTAHSLTADGIVGAKTWAKLLA